MNIKNIRNKYPEYNDMSDIEFADKFHNKYYSDIPKEEFYSKLGIENKKNDNLFVINKNTNQSLIPDKKERNDLIGNMIAMSSLAVPELKAANMLGKIASPLTKKAINYIGNIGQNALIGSAVGAANPNQNSSDTAKNYAIGTAVLNPVIGVAGKILPVISKQIEKVVMPERAVKKDLLQHSNIDEIKNAMELMGKSRKLNIPLTALEALNNPIAKSVSEQIQSTPSSSRILYNFEKNRKENEKLAIEKLLNTISSKDSKKLIEEPMYKASLPKIVNENELGKIIYNSKRLKKAFKNIHNDVDFGNAVKNIPVNSVGFIDKVKQYLDNKIEKYSTKEPTRAFLISSERNKLLKIADKVSPEYALARDAAEKRLVREEIENSINKNDMSGKEIYKKFLKPDKKFNELRFHLRDRNNITKTSIAQKKIDVLRDVLSNMDNLFTNKGAKVIRDENKNIKFGAMENLKDLIKGFGNNRYNKAMAEFVTNPNWEKDALFINKIKDPNKKMDSFANLLKKIAITGTAQGYSEENEP